MTGYPTKVAMVWSDWLSQQQGRVDDVGRLARLLLTMECDECGGSHLPDPRNEDAYDMITFWDMHALITAREEWLAAYG